MKQEAKPDEITEQDKVVYGAIPQAFPLEPSRPESEIDLVDLWLVLYRRKGLLMLVMLLFTLAATGYALLKPKEFAYSASLQVGALVNAEGNGNRIGAIEKPEFVVSRLNETIIPHVLHSYQGQYPETRLPEIKARIPKKSDLIVIETKGYEGNGETYKKLITEIADKVVNEHQPLMTMVQRNYESQLKQEEIKLAELEDPSTLASELKTIEVDLVEARLKLEELNDLKLRQVARQELETEYQQHVNKNKMLIDELKLVKSEINRLDRLEQLLLKQIAELKLSIETTEANRKNSVNELSDEPSAMTQLLLDNQLQSSRDQLAKLEERLVIEQPARRGEVANMIHSIELNQAVAQKSIEQVKDRFLKLDVDLGNQKQQQKSLIEELEQKIDKLKLDSQLAVQTQKTVIGNARSRLDSFKPTRLVFEPIKSMEPVGLSVKLIVVMALILGVLVGIFLIFGLEFKARVAEKIRQLPE